MFYTTTAKPPYCCEDGGLGVKGCIGYSGNDTAGLKTSQVGRDPG